jgi:hypothetical protein
MRGVSAARLAGAAWAAIIAAGFAAGAIGGAIGGAIADGGPGCPFNAITRVPCPFCGMTHAVIAMGGGDLRGALQAHPAAPLVVAIVLALALAVALDRVGTLVRGWRGLALIALIGIAWVAKLVAFACA